MQRFKTFYEEVLALHITSHLTFCVNIPGVSSSEKNLDDKEILGKQVHKHMLKETMRGF